MALDLTSFDSFLKETYSPEAVEDLVYKDNPLFALVKKHEEFGGKNKNIGLIYGNPQGRSATFSNAQTRGAATSSQVTDFTLTRVSDYSIATIDNETLLASKGDKNAFLEATTTEIDGAINSLTRSIATAMYRTSAGEIGQVSAEPAEAASTVITMKSAGDITNIEVGMALNIHSALSGGSQRSLDGSTTQMIVSAVDRSNGTFTIGTAYDSSGTIAANDYIFVEGDRGAKISGLASWLPTTAPTSGDSFFGVDRSVDVTRLAGVRYNGSSDPIDEALIEGASRVAREGGKVDHCFLSYSKFAELEKALGAKVQYVDLSMSAEVGFRGIQIHGPRGTIKVVPDMNCPDDKAYMLQLNTWGLHSIGKAVRAIDTDSLQMLRQASSDGVEVRWGFYGNLACKAPGFNAVVTL